MFYPSLHLSLAADYVKLRRPEAARIHLARARAATGALADDGYGNGVRAAIARLERRLAAEPGEGPPPVPRAVFVAAPRARIPVRTRGGGQSSWTPAQIRASGLSGCQRPCRRPRAQTSAGRTGSSFASSRGTRCPGSFPWCGRPRWPSPPEPPRPSDSSRPSDPSGRPCAPPAMPPGLRDVGDRRYGLLRPPVAASAAGAEAGGGRDLGRSRPPGRPDAESVAFSASRAGAWTTTGRAPGPPRAP
ncbi:hypothetical protein GCM10020254_19230 [Streptomyces goshikiensis]